MNPAVIPYGALGLAIVAEVIATSLLSRTGEFTRLLPTVGVLSLYGVAFYFLTIALRVIPVGIAYALWSGLGIVLVAGVNYLLFRHTLDLPAILGLGLIIAGIVVINLFSGSVTH